MTVKQLIKELSRFPQDMKVKVLAFFETEPAPYGFLIEHGACVPFTGKLKYYRDDNGEEVFI